MIMSALYDLCSNNEANFAIFFSKAISWNPVHRYLEPFKSANNVLN